MGNTAFPGGYPIYFITVEGDCLCPQCVKEKAHDFHRAIRQKKNNLSYFKSDLLVGCDIHWEGEPIVCEECAKSIESAYGVPEKA